MDDTRANNTVDSRASFVEFVALLRQDFLKSPNSWENNTLESFLEALGRYAEDIQGYYDNCEAGVNADEPSWQNFANILRGASMYE
ncbi:hypothetical protein [Hymenobacter sp. YC55]|uniref:DUF7660 family protein n=1 Tax=Hymenobacter sp. YC55 TaxID=3034019 RepID=UPI0023F6B138|nr:hypothetical protein [Hymenobacter sp. YC55]MDF7810152.1 hypothetical protein [Hymenobacter sp. YC55]